MKLIFGILIALISYGGLLYLGYYIFKNYIKPIKVEDIETSNEIVSNDIIRFEDIDQGVLKKPNNEYVSYILVPSLNIALMNEIEVQSIERMYARLINKLNFPIVHHIQTTPLDNESIVNVTKKSYIEMTRNFRGLEEYGDQYIAEISRLSHHMKRTTHKTKYVLIPYIVENPEQFESKEEMDNHAREVLEERTSQIMNDLSGMKINAKRLWDYDIIKLIYISMQRDLALFKDLVASGEYERRMVLNKKNLDIRPDENIDLSIVETINKIEVAIYEAQLKIKEGAQNSDVTGRRLKEHKEIITELMEIQRKVLEVRELHGQKTD